MTSRRQCPRGVCACECLHPPPLSGNPVSAPAQVPAAHAIIPPLVSRFLDTPQLYRAYTCVVCDYYIVLNPDLRLFTNTPMHRPVARGGGGGAPGAYAPPRPKLPLKKA